ncbi:hypothetical protein PV415_39245 [Streptomyces sp. ME03-5684b]|uniref:hypothetical protein n=1 Tax=Streptomyces sp. ME03-5684b TaxID=3028681 RepID=UPI0029A84602|nr:hypothetical protein [Streptomyces sp. ME03-5684b]MDX3322931.1 hypothetical protein [Streptomyces sp. ME03-5684b]
MTNEASEHQDGHSDISINSPEASLVVLHDPSPDRRQTSKKLNEIVVFRPLLEPLHLPGVAVIFGVCRPQTHHTRVSP